MPDDLMAVAERYGAWLHSHDTGLSSEAIFHYMALGVRGGIGPSDPADLGRCLRLLDRFPEWDARMPEMVEVHDDWRDLMPHWDNVVATFNHEAGTARRDKWGIWKAPKTYELMKRIYADAESARASQSGVA